MHRDDKYTANKRYAALEPLTRPRQLHSSSTLVRLDAYLLTCLLRIAGSGGSSGSSIMRVLPGQAQAQASRGDLEVLDEVLAQLGLDVILDAPLVIPQLLLGRES